MNKVTQLIIQDNGLQLTNWTSPEVFYTNGLQEFHFDLDGTTLTLSSWDMHCHCFLDDIQLCLGDPQLTLKASKFIQKSRKPFPWLPVEREDLGGYQKPQEEQNAREAKEEARDCTITWSLE